MILPRLQHQERRTSSLLAWTTRTWQYDTKARTEEDLLILSKSDTVQTSSAGAEISIGEQSHAKEKQNTSEPDWVCDYLDPLTVGPAISALGSPCTSSHRRRRALRLFSFCCDSAYLTQNKICNRKITTRVYDLRRHYIAAPTNGPCASRGR